MTTNRRSEHRRTANRPTVWAAALVAVLALAAAGCSSDDESADGSGDATTTTAAEESTTTAPETLTILVTNDDGVAAEGIDVLVEALRALPDTEVVVSAPAENQSGSGSKTTPGGVEGAPAATASGFEASAVPGFPADSVNWALDGGIEVTPDLVISGINSGQNIGALVEVSGTVGAARAAAAKGIPALAVSQGIADAPDFPAAAELVVAWVEENREAILSGEFATDTIENLNVPTCTAGEVRGLVEVELDTAAQVSFDPVDCSQTTPQPAGDVAAFAAGFAPLSVISATPAG